MSIESNKKVVTRFNKEFLENGDSNVLKEIVSEDFVNHTAADNLPNDTSGLIQVVELLHRGFPDLRIEIHQQIGEDDLVASRKTISGTHLGEILGHKPTGKEVVIHVMDIVRLKDGKYTDHWGRNDMMQVIEGL